MNFIVAFLAVFAAIAVVSGSVINDQDNEKNWHPGVIRDPTKQLKQDPEVYETKEHWHNSAQKALKAKIAERKIEKQAKNVIFFLGDGMSVPTIAAARVLKGQKVDNLKWGEEAELHFEQFPHIGVSKTFCADAQVADSACSATAYLCGTKAQEATMGLSPAVARRDCAGQVNKENHVSSILAWSQAAGKSTGIVTTARVTHASPGAAYAHIADREWENDYDVDSLGQNATICRDIAKQLVFDQPGRDINVIMGGGRVKFLPQEEQDHESEIPVIGQRLDGFNLANEWKTLHPNKSSYITGYDQLLGIDTKNTDYLLGLFSSGHVSYKAEHEADNDASLEEMTRVAIEILSKNPKGFFLFVEGGRIDHAHHDGYLQRALWETIEFDKAIQKADEMTDVEDTLILVTADHAHVMTFNGYPKRGNPIMGVTAEVGSDGLPYPTLSYANGLGYKADVYDPEESKCKRYNMANDPSEDLNHKPIATIPRSSETHGGDDVLIYSRGPFAHFLTGVQQQSYIPHLLAYASCVGDFEKYCDGTPPTDSGTTPNNFNSPSVLLGSFYLVLIFMWTHFFTGRQHSHSF